MLDKCGDMFPLNLNFIHVLSKNFKSSVIAHTLELQNEEDEAGES